MIDSDNNVPDIIDVIKEWARDEGLLDMCITDVNEGNSNKWIFCITRDKWIDLCTDSPCDNLECKTCRKLKITKE